MTAPGSRPTFPVTTGNVPGLTPPPRPPSAPSPTFACRHQACGQDDRITSAIESGTSQRSRVQRRRRDVVGNQLNEGLVAAFSNEQETAECQHRDRAAVHALLECGGTCGGFCARHPSPHRALYRRRGEHRLPVIRFSDHHRARQLTDRSHHDERSTLASLPRDGTARLSPTLTRPAVMREPPGGGLHGHELAPCRAGRRAGSGIECPSSSSHTRLTCADELLRGQI